MQQTRVIELVFVEEISKILESASKIYNKLVGKGEIVCVDNMFAVKLSEEKTRTYKSLSLSDKMCVFLALRLCSLEMSFPNFNTVLLHGQIGLNNKEMISRLKNLKGKNFITEAMSAAL